MGGDLGSTAFRARSRPFAAALVDVCRRAVHDPFTVLLVAAAAVQLTLVQPAGLIARPAWVVGAVLLFVGACVVAVIGRRRDDVRLHAAAPYILLAVAFCWRAATREALTGFGALSIVAVIWLALYGTRRQVWAAVAAVPVVMLVPPLIVGESITANDWRRLLLTGVVALFFGPTANSLARRGAAAARRADDLEPAGSRLDAVLRAATGTLVVVCDPDGTIVDANPGAERMLGYRADELVGHHSLVDVHDPDEIAARAAELGVEPGFEAFSAATRGDDDVDIRDWTCLAKDGHRVVVSLAVSRITDATGRLTGYVAVGTDVTAAHTNLDALTAQREIYRLLVEHLPMTTVALFDEELRCLTIGGHWLAKIGVDGGRFRGQPIEDFFRPPDRQPGRELYERARTQPVDVEMDLSDGRCYEFAALPVTGPQGRPWVLSVARDITDRRRAEAERQQIVTALAVSEASFREAFENAPIGMALTSAQGGPGERFLRVNPAFAEILGRRPEDLVDVPVAEVTHAEDAALRPDLASTGALPKLRKRFVRPSGRAIWVEVSYTVVRAADGTPSHIIKQIQDIHTIKESERALLDALEQQRAATASLRELDRIRTDLVGTISHELRTPLTSIHGYLELLGDEDLTRPQRSMLEVATRNADRLAALVDNLLVLVRLDSAESDVAMTSADVVVADAVASALDTVRPEITERGQHLSVTMSAADAVVRGDAEQLDRVLVNLLSNASKYTPNDGRVAVVVATVDGKVHITVCDTGIGIPADEQAQLFHRFFRASTARENSISGNGLGLAIVKSIVERHGGRITVESERGAGARFTVTLPLAARAAAVAG